MAGYACEFESWRVFDRLWMATLTQYGLDLHMKHFAHRKGLFRSGWEDESKRVSLMSALLDLIAVGPFRPFGACLKIGDFNALPEDMQKRFVAPGRRDGFAGEAGARQASVEVVGVVET